jgi:hypothetical protein
MVEFYTQFSSILDVVTAENAERAETVRGEFAAELYREDGGYPGFVMEVDHETGPGALRRYSNDQGEPDHVIGFVPRRAEALNLAGVWSLSWGNSCSKPRRCVRRRRPRARSRHTPFHRRHRPRQRR